MKKLFGFILLAMFVFIFVGCSSLGLRPTNTAYNYFHFEADSKANVQSGTQGSQANAIHAAVTGGNAVDGEVGTADGEAKLAKQTSLFGNSAVGDRATDVAASAALETLKNVRGTSVGQSQAQTKGDESPGTSTQEQVPTQTETKTTNIPVAVSQQGASATTEGAQSDTGGN